MWAKDTLAGRSRKSLVIVGCGWDINLVVVLGCWWEDGSGDKAGKMVGALNVRVKSKVLCVCVDGGPEEWEYINERRLLCRQIIGRAELEHVLG